MPNPVTASLALASAIAALSTPPVVPGMTVLTTATE